MYIPWIPHRPLKLKNPGVKLIDVGIISPYVVDINPPVFVFSIRNSPIAAGNSLTKSSMPSIASFTLSKIRLSTGFATSTSYLSFQYLHKSANVFASSSLSISSPMTSKFPAFGSNPILSMSIIGSAMQRHWIGWPRCPSDGGILHLFQSTPDLRRATGRGEVCKRFRVFQSTPDLRRATRRCVAFWYSLSLFQSTPDLRRATRMSFASENVLSSFQSTPSVRRATDISVVGDVLVLISIHALRAEGDRVPKASCYSRNWRACFANLQN